MKTWITRVVLGAGLIAVASGCGLTQYWNDAADEGLYDDPFWARYLIAGDPLDDAILETLEALRVDASSPVLHNRLGRLLVRRDFPKDAEWEFKRALELDSDFYPAAYNIALARQARGDRDGAKRALRRTLRMKPGHAAAHFQLGLMYEEDGDVDKAVHHYARAYSINRALLDVSVNPRVIDSELVDLALLELYDDEHLETSIRLEPVPENYPVPGRFVAPGDIEAPSDVEAAEEIVPPAPPITDDN